MKVTKVTVSASSGFNHPYEDYANFRPAVTLEAEIEQDDSWGDVVKYLQGKAEKLVQDQKQEILDDLHRIREIHRVQSDLGYARKRQKENSEYDETIKDLEKQLEALVGGGSKEKRLPQLSEECPD